MRPIDRAADDPMPFQDLAAADILNLNQRWTGDYDDLAERRFLRVLVPFSRTLYYLDGPEQKGIAYEALRELESSAAAHRRIEGAAEDRHHSDDPRPPAAGARRRLWRRRDRRVHRHRPAARNRRVLGSDDARDRKRRRHGQGRARRADGSRSRRQRDSRAACEQLLRGSRRAQRRGSTSAGLARFRSRRSMRGSRKRTCCRWSTPGSFRRPSASVRSRNSGRSSMTSSSCTRRWRCAPTGRSRGRCAKTRRRSRRSSTISSSSTAPARCSATSCCSAISAASSGSRIRRAPREAREVSRDGAALPHLRRPVRLRLAPWRSRRAIRNRSSTNRSAARPALSASCRSSPRRRRTATSASTTWTVSRTTSTRASSTCASCAIAISRIQGIDPLDQGLCSRSPPTTPGPRAWRSCGRRPTAVGLDPNQWFGNVEIIAAREIGRETVDYVSNIYKYYSAYKAFAARQEDEPGAPN